MLEIETLVVQLENARDEGTREIARSLVRAVMDLHGAALARILDGVSRVEGGRALLREVALDDAVGCVLSLHGLNDEKAPAAPRPGEAGALAPRSGPSKPRPDPTPENFVPVERLLARRSSPARTAEEDKDVCDLCSAPLGERHDHLVDAQSRDLRCTCGPCASLFGIGKEGRWKRVRHRADRLHGFHLEDDSWNALGIPIELAFFFRSSRDHRVVAMYPSPAGATESLLSLDAWARVEKENPVLGDLEPDVEALLVRRGRGGREHYRVSIDACYALVGRIRKHWRGLGGGTEVWSQIGSFFDDLRATTAPEGARA